jgi:hypothetical protein
MSQIPFVGGAYQSRSLKLDAQRCVNFYPVRGESGTAKAVAALFGTPGLRLLTTLGGVGGIRAEYPPSNGGDAIVVQGSSVYRVSTGFVSTFVGTIDLLLTPVSIADNGTTAVLVTGPNGYRLDLASNNLTKITDPAFYGAARVSYNNVTFIFERPGTNQFYVTSPGTISFDELDFASAESNAEPIVSHIINHGELLLFKRTVTEVWSDSGNADFPYAENSNASIEQGCAAAHSVVDLDNSVFWLGGDKNGTGIVWRLNGYTPQRISHAGIEKAIQGYSDISDAIGFAQQKEGQTFYFLTFPTGNATWVYDVATQLWHERAYLLPASGVFQRHRGNSMMFFGGEHVVGDWENGNLYALDLECYTDNGDPLVSLRAAAHIADGAYKNIRFHELEVDIEAGVGLETGLGSDPKMMLRWSNDGGKTWSPLREMTMGRIGEFKARARATRLGKARDRVYEISISDPVKRVIVGASVNATGLTR